MNWESGNEQRPILPETGIDNNPNFILLISGPVCGVFTNIIMEQQMFSRQTNRPNHVISSFA
ncbi:hypothetical protein [Bacillus sp. FJAT-49736]|uniref:hypothetical protein n=1 Tax=Bacillus sp. FJAT-49736 TaxID=2833582 RepID=UPI001BC9B88F|nr:hypothetical protein [Bacillus sp. FJAT-49736]MBS4174831.1 hypothetical protein [Bacillus sp. FJAT-49736]MBS4175512.1 hypothetical protein [Bacillus sp. FJAT-49736]